MLLYNKCPYVRTFNSLGQIIGGDAGAWIEESITMHARRIDHARKPRSDGAGPRRIIRIRL